MRIGIDTKVLGRLFADGDERQFVVACRLVEEAAEADEPVVMSSLSKSPRSNGRCTTGAIGRAWNSQTAS